MVLYKDFIDQMKKIGYTLNDNPIIIDESNSNINTFTVKNGSIGKILELQCPENSVISACGSNENYFININCFDDENHEPFQEYHQCIILTPDRHIIADIIVTKVLNNKINRNDPDIQQFLIYTDPILRFINSKNSSEYPIWSGNYKTLYKEFLNESFNLFGNEKMIFYAVKPDISMTKIKFEMKADLFEIKKPEELIILDIHKITDIKSLDYKSVAKVERS